MIISQVIFITANNATYVHLRLAAILVATAYTVPLNYNYETICVYMQGNTTQRYTVHILRLREPHFSYRVNMHFTCKIPCNTCGVAFHMRGHFTLVALHTHGTWNCTRVLFCWQ